MKTIKNLLCLFLLIFIAYSCEPEELPSETVSTNDITADTGDQDNEVDYRGEE